MGFTMFSLRFDSHSSKKLEPDAAGFGAGEGAGAPSPGRDAGGANGDGAGPKPGLDGGRLPKGLEPGLSGACVSKRLKIAAST